MAEARIADIRRFILLANEPKKIALKDIAISSVETIEPVVCLFRLKPSSRVPTIKGRRVAGEFPITSKATPPRRVRFKP